MCSYNSFMKTVLHWYYCSYAYIFPWMVMLHNGHVESLIILAQLQIYILKRTSMKYLNGILWYMYCYYGKIININYKIFYNTPDIISNLKIGYKEVIENMGSDIYVGKQPIRLCSNVIVITSYLKERILLRNMLYQLVFLLLQRTWVSGAWHITYT